MDEINDVVELIKKIRDDKRVKIKFTKKDGTSRVMTCTLDFKSIPKEHRPKGIDIVKIIKLVQNQGILHAYDLEKQDWRSITFSRVEWVEDYNNKRFYIKRFKDAKNSR